MKREADKACYGQELQGIQRWGYCQRHGYCEAVGTTWLCSSRQVPCRRTTGQVGAKMVSDIACEKPTASKQPHVQREGEGVTYPVVHSGGRMLSLLPLAPMEHPASGQKMPSWWAQISLPRWDHGTHRNGGSFSAQLVYMNVHVALHRHLFNPIW